MPMYYKTDARKLSNAELWRCAPNPFAFAVLWVRVALGLWRSTRTGIVVDPKLELVELSDLPKLARISLRERIAACEEVGMAFSFAYTIPVLGAQSFAAALLSPDRQTWGNVAWLRMTRGWLDHIETECAFATKFVDGTLFLTADMPGVFDLPPGWGGRIFPGARPRHLFAHHQEELAARQNARPVSLDQDGLKQLVTDVRVRVAEFMIGRGVWAPLTEEEVKCIRRESMPDE